MVTNSTGNGATTHISSSVPAAVLLATLMFFSFVLNIGVCIAIIRCSKLRIASSVFIFNLCLGDIFITVFSMSLWLWFHIEGEGFSRQFRDFTIVFMLWSTVDIFSGTLSILSLAAISVDKYMAITRPLRYNTDITKRTNTVAILLIWIYSISAPSIYWAKNDVHRKTLAYFLACICLLLPLLVIVVVYSKIYVIARSHAIVLSQQSGRHKAREIKAAKTIAVVIGTFCICWIPFFVIVILFSHGVRVSKDFANAAKWLTYLNAFLNPVVYTLLDRRFRFVFISKVMPCLKSRSDTAAHGKEGSSDPSSTELRGQTSLIFSRKRKASKQRSNDVAEL